MNSGLDACFYIDVVLLECVYNRVSIDPQYIIY